MWSTLNQTLNQHIPDIYIPFERYKASFLMGDSPTEISSVSEQTQLHPVDLSSAWQVGYITD